MCALFWALWRCSSEQKQGVNHVSIQYQVVGMALERGQGEGRCYSRWSPWRRFPQDDLSKDVNTEECALQILTGRKGSLGGGDRCSGAQSCLTLCDPMDLASLSLGNYRIKDRGARTC